MKEFDNKYFSNSVMYLAGCDEAGRGPLAGPVVAAAVIFPKDFFLSEINDSKKLSFKKREILFQSIVENSLAYSVSCISHGKIDQINILNSSLLAMKTAIQRLKIKPDLILIDGNRSFQYDVPVIPIVKGDSKSFTVAAASIVAKVIRDRIMIRLSEYYPQYGWQKNKGYPTRKHLEALKIFGESPLHRKTFLKKFYYREKLSYSVV